MRKHLLLAASILTSATAASAPARAVEVTSGFHHSNVNGASSGMNISSQHIEALGTSFRNFSMLSRAVPGVSAPQENVSATSHGFNFRGAMFHGQFPALTQQSQLISSLHGGGFGSSSNTTVATQPSQLQPTTQLAHFNAVNPSLLPHIGKSTSGDCGEGSASKLRQAYLINVQEPILHKNAFATHIVTPDNLPWIGTGKFRRYGFDTVDPRILRSLSGTTFGTSSPDITNPTSLGYSIEAKSTQPSFRAGKSNFGLVNFPSLAKVHDSLPFDYHSNNFSSQNSIDDGNYRLRHGLHVESPSKVKNLTSLSYSSEYKSSQFISADQNFTARINFNLDEIRKVRTSSMFGINSSKSIFDPNCFQSQFKNVHINFSSLASTQIPGATNMPTFQLLPLDTRTLTPFLLPVLPTTSITPFTFANRTPGLGTVPSMAISPESNNQHRELIVQIRPHIVF